MTDFRRFGPFDLVYHWADQVFNNTQDLLAAENVSDFVDSVRWNEPFIRALILAQVMLFLVTFLSRRRDLIQFFILLLITLTTLSAEKLNLYGRKHWSRFATQDYFDSQGLFMLVFMSGPFVLLANFIVIGMGLRLVKMYAKKARQEAQARHSRPASTRTEDRKDR